MDIKHYFESILAYTLEHRISDIHFVPNQVFGVIQIRNQKNKMEIIAELPNEEMRQITSYIKYIAGLSLAHLTMESGVLHYLLNTKTIDLRVALMPMAYDELLTLRIHHQSIITGFDAITDDRQDQMFFRNLCNQKQGMIILSGATGSGKTTTIYAMVRLLLSMNKHIITIEDPVEQLINGVMQLEVNEKNGRNYDSIISQCLRHDPDVLIIGEIRSSYVAQSAVRAALTGHLVIATLHAQSSVKVIQRLLDLGCSKELLAVTLLASSYQELIVQQERTICKFEYIDAHAIARVLQQDSRELVYG